MLTNPTPKAELPDIPEELKQTLAKKATELVCTKGRVPTIAYLTVTFVENAKLVAEINRLRAELNIEPLPVFKPE